MNSDTLDGLIGDAVSDDTHDGGNDALDKVTIRISAPDDDDVDSGESSTRRRSRPAGDGKGARKSKKQLQEDYDALVSELAAERARHNTEAVSELAQMVEMCSFLVFGMVAQKRGKHWGMTTEEAKTIGASGALALAPHADTLRKYAPWSMFAATVGGAIYARIQEDYRIAGLNPEPDIAPAA